MWRSEQARNEAILKMLSTTPGVLRVWSNRGPSDEAVRLLDADGGYLSSGERLLLKAAFDLWNGRGHCRVDELLDALDEKRLRAVAEALMARDAPMADAMIAEREKSNRKEK